MKADDSLAQIIETVVDQRQLDEHPEFREQLDRILAGLNEIDRKLIELRLNGFNTTDAAKRLSLDPNIARVRLSRARRKLAQNPLLADYL